MNWSWLSSSPPADAGLALEAGLCQRIISDLGDQPGTLPLLQYTLTELFERRVGRRLTLAAYQDSGGVLGALGKRAEEIYSALDSADKETTRQVFLRLVTLGEGVEDTRRRVLLSELEALSPSAVNGDHGLSRVLDSFGRARLLSFDRDPAHPRPHRRSGPRGAAARVVPPARVARPVPGRYPRASACWATRPQIGCRLTVIPASCCAARAWTSSPPGSSPPIWPSPR